jgi:hypothetical protein
MIILPRQARDKHRENTQKRVAFSYSFKLSDVPGLHSTGGCTAYSVWEGKSLGQVTADGGFAAKAVGSRDSVFLTLSGCQ